MAVVTGEAVSAQTVSQLTRVLDQAVEAFCQRKVEMSGFSLHRNVRFHGLLQGWSAGTWYLGLILF